MLDDNIPNAVAQGSTFFESTCPFCRLPVVLEVAHDEMERRRSEAHPDCTTHCPGCGASYHAHVLLGPGLADVQPALGRSSRHLEERLRAARGHLDAALQEGQRLREDVRAAGREIVRLRGTVALGEVNVKLAQRWVGDLEGELAGARAEVGDLQGEVAGVCREVGDLQGEVAGARREVEVLTARLTRHQQRDETVRRQLRAARVEADGLRAEVARLEAEAAGRGGAGSSRAASGQWPPWWVA